MGNSQPAQQKSGGKSPAEAPGGGGGKICAKPAQPFRHELEKKRALVITAATYGPADEKAHGAPTSVAQQIAAIQKRQAGHLTISSKVAFDELFTDVKVPKGVAKALKITYHYSDEKAAATDVYAEEHGPICYPSHLLESNPTERIDVLCAVYGLDPLKASQCTALFTHFGSLGKIQLPNLPYSEALGVGDPQPGATKYLILGMRRFNNTVVVREFVENSKDCFTFSTDKS